MRKKPIWQLILGDMLMTGLILCVFALFHHVIPMYKAFEPVEDLVSTGERASLADGKEWADVFTEEPVFDELSYSGPNAAVKISEIYHENEDLKIRGYVADIYIKDIESLETVFVEDELAAEPMALAESAGAIIAVNGDFCRTQNSGLLVRNGVLYRKGDSAMDICVIYRDGSVETYKAGSCSEEEILAKDPWQILRFGPSLLDEDGNAIESFTGPEMYNKKHPRTGFGYYEPGHYCFVVVDGRTRGHSDGCKLDFFAEIFEELGCSAAYNLDGGASTVMVFNGETINWPCSGGRDVGDMLAIVEVQNEED